jgi:hypothetical protein
VATKIAKPIRREITVDGESYIVTLSPDGLRIARKRHRSGIALSWKAVIRQLQGMKGGTVGPPDSAD